MEMYSTKDFCYISYYGLTPSPKRYFKVFLNYKKESYKCMLKKNWIKYDIIYIDWISIEGGTYG